MTGLYSALFAMAFTSVAWLAKIGAVLGVLFGLGLAYLPIARVLRAQGEGSQRLAVRRLAGVACLVWGLVLPTAFGAAGLLWGLARGLGNVVEGPVSTTVRATTHTWLTRANGLRASVGILGRYPLAKRLTEGELTAVVHAAPEWIAEILRDDDPGALARKAEIAHVPAPVLAFVRQELHARTGGQGAWLLPALDGLRARTQGNAANRPTMQEAIEAMVAPSVFEDAARKIRAKGGHYVRWLAFVSFGLSGLLAAILWRLWKRPLSAAKPDAAPVERAHG